MEEVDLGHKRDRQEESTTDLNPTKMEEKYPLIRERTDYCFVKMSLDGNIIFDPPEISQLLEFTVDLEKEDIDKLTDKIKTGISKSQREETENWVKELGKIITEDPRLGKLLQEDFLRLVLDFLADEQNPKLQFYAATIITPVVAHTTNRKVVKEYIKPSVIVNLVSSKDRDLQVQALQLLRTIALGIPDHPEIETILEGAFKPLISFFTDGSPNHESLRFGSLTLAIVCQVHPNLPHDKFKTAVVALTKLIQYESEEYYIDEVVPHACCGLSYLCDGRKEMVVEAEYFEELVDRLIVLVDSTLRAIVIDGFVALGSIVRWASDEYIEVLIKKDVLYSLECLLREEHKYFVMDACWILSNITARNQIFLDDVIRCQCIGSLVNVVQNYKLSEVRKEAAWAIMNAIYVASPDQIKYLRKSCVKALWEFSKVFKDNLDIVYACLEVLVKLEVVDVTYSGKSVTNSDFRKHVLMLQGKPFQLADDDDVEGLPKSKKLRTTYNIGKFDGAIGFLLTCTFKEVPELQQTDTQLFSVNNGNSRHVSGDSANVAESEMDVDVPK